jgi:hypothetical protein
MPYPDIPYIDAVKLTWAALKAVDEREGTNRAEEYLRRVSEMRKEMRAAAARNSNRNHKNRRPRV